MKNVWLPALMLIIGIITGFLIGSKKQSEVATSVNQANHVVNPEVKTFSIVGVRPTAKAKGIPKALAQQLIARYVQENTGATTPLLAEGGAPLMGFFIDRGSLKKIDSALAKTGYDGISLYLAKHPDHMDPADNSHIYTIVFAGAIANPKGRAGGSVSDGTTQYLNADTYEYVDPCPDHCGDQIPPPVATKHN